MGSISSKLTIILEIMFTFLCYRKSHLAELNLKFGIPNVWKPPPADVATQAVLDKVVEDTAQTRGVGTISTLLRNKGILLPW